MQDVKAEPAEPQPPPGGAGENGEGPQADGMAPGKVQQQQAPQAQQHPEHQMPRNAVNYAAIFESPVMLPMLTVSDLPCLYLKNGD
jgi:hypothetical protein